MAIEPKELRGALEAILFVATEPVKLEELVDAFPDEGSEAIGAQLEAIRQTLVDHVGGFVLEQTAGGYRLATGPEHDATLRRFFAKKGEGRLSLAALETLAIIAYRQPVTAPEISDIRGVNSTAVIRTLLERKMIRVAGRKNVVGSPFLYRTTRDFLVHFGLNDIQDLPRLEEFADLIGENIVDDLTAMPTQVGMFDDEATETSSPAMTRWEAAAPEEEREEDLAGSEPSFEDRIVGHEAASDHEEMYEDREGTIESDAIDEQHK